jgi:succinate-semialdehyde dehydrogenase/glutarate-semialdehyde dehydrogenase
MSPISENEIVITRLKTELFIGGKWLKGSGGKPIEVLDPSTKAVITSVESASVDDAISAVDAASEAFSGWASTSPRQRAEILMRAFYLMKEKAEWFAQLISLENGKALPDARGEVAYAAEFFRWYSEEAVRAIGQISNAPNGGNRILTQYEPVGVSLFVTPWNFPAAMATRKIAPALAAGCTCILKPASETPLTAYAIAALLIEAGVPAGVVNVITSSQSGKVASAILHDPRVRKLSFTGSTAVGRILLRESADCVVNCSMELGGNAPFIVFDDADVDLAVDAAMVAKMRNAGEACTAANRFYVHESVSAEFTEKLTTRMAGMTVGKAYDAATTCGPLINQSAVDDMVRLVADAVEKGAQLQTGGDCSQNDGFFFPPTVLSGVSHDAEILKEEIFGPIAPIVTFSDEREVVQLANDTIYGLVSYVFSKDLARALNVAERLGAGMIAINRGLVSDPAALFGGTKQSGIGREGGHEGMLEYLEPKYVAVSW